MGAPYMGKMDRNKNSSKMGTGGRRRNSKVCPLCGRTRSVEWLHREMFVVVTSLCLAFSDADIEYDFVLMTIGHTGNT